MIDAMEALYKSACDGICVVSSDSDFTALATKIREGGKDVYGIGGTKTPKSFRSACTAFVTLANVGSGGVVETAQSVPVLGAGDRWRRRRRSRGSPVFTVRTAVVSR